MTGTRCASVNGFSLHANPHIPAHRRDQHERLIRYTARGAVSLERLEQDANGDLLYTFTRPWADGTTGIKLSPLELLEKLAALVPLPRVHLVRYGGCLAPHSKRRGAVIPTPRQQGVEESDTRTPSPHWSWARLLKRVFAIAMERCPRCQQGTLRIIAAITEGSVITQILRHLKLAVDPPPIAPARQATFAWAVSSPSRALRADVRLLLDFSLPLVPPLPICVHTLVRLDQAPHAALPQATPWSAWAFSELFHKSTLLKAYHLRLSKSVGAARSATLAAPPPAARPAAPAAPVAGCQRAATGSGAAK